MVSWADRFPKPPSGALWRFAVDFYARPGVAPACLDLQDRYDRDVNLVLFSCWVGIAGRGRLSLAGLAAADAAAEPWRRTVVAPLRVVRRLVKEAGEVDTLYTALKAAELEAEHRALDRLEMWAPPPLPMASTDPVGDAHANLLLYLGPGPAFAAAHPLRVALSGRDRPD